MGLTVEKIVLNEECKVSLTVMKQAFGEETGKTIKRPAVLILPGGGYSLCADHEAEPVAYPYLEAGFQAFVLRYSVAEHKAWPNPLDDYEKAMELIRDRADEWQVLDDKIAVIGFSAGGHLAACAATASRNRPAAAVLCYAATSAELTAMMHLDPQGIVPTEQVSGETCPCFLMTARDDMLVSVRNALDFEQALVDHGIMFESHVYAYGGHGFSTCSKSFWSGKVCSRAPHWVRDSIEWLGDMFGEILPDGLAEPSCAAKINGDFEKTLSARCTIGHLKRQGHLVEQILEPVLAVISKIFQASGQVDAIVSLMIDSMPLDSAMKTLMMDETEIAEIDSALKKYRVIL